MESSSPTTKEFVFESLGEKAYVEVSSEDTLAKVRELILEELDSHQFPSGDDTDFGFKVNRIRISTKQESKRKAFALLDKEAKVELVPRSITTKRKVSQEAGAKSPPNSVPSNGTAGISESKRRKLNTSASVTPTTETKPRREPSENDAPSPVHSRRNLVSSFTKAQSSPALTKSKNGNEQREEPRNKSNTTVTTHVGGAAARSETMAEYFAKRNAVKDARMEDSHLERPNTLRGRRHNNDMARNGRFCKSSRDPTNAPSGSTLRRTPKGSCTRSRSSQEKNDRELAKKLRLQSNRVSSQFAKSAEDPPNAPSSSGSTLRRTPRWSNSQEKSDWEMEQEQESLFASNMRRVSNRIPRKKKRATNADDEPVVLSSDNEKEPPVDDQDRVYDLFRIALGKRVFGNDCQMIFSPRCKEVTLEFCKSNRVTRNSNSEKERVRFTLNQDTLKVFKFYRKTESDGTDLSDSDDDEPFGTPAGFNFVAIQVRPRDGSNNLSKYPNIYQPETKEAPNKNRYIVFEFQEDDDFDHFHAEMEHHLAEIIPPGKIEKKESHMFGEVLIEHSRKMANSRMAKQSQSAFIKGRNSESTLLVFPFAADPAQIEAAADGLQEPSGKLKASRGCISDSSDEESDEQDPREPSSPSNASGETTDSKIKVRQHYVTLCVKDYERLQPEEPLNDSLIDFWMQWISRNEDKSTTNIHFFSSHFYSTLSRDGLEAVTSWTAKMNINVFEKKFIFIPIDHWSLCVVVNPGCITNAYEADRDKKAKLDIPCLIFMESMRIYKKTTIRKKIENWLNSEYERIHPDAEIPRPFDRDRFELFTPKVPMQNNTWDCGVFVCRYALAIYKLRNRSFTFRDVHGNSPFSRIVAGGAEFDFNMNDIFRFRGEFQKLIENLSRVYANWKRGGEKANPKSESKKKSSEAEVSAEGQNDEKETSDEQGMTDEKIDDEVTGSPSDDESMDIVNDNDSASIPYADV